MVNKKIPGKRPFAQDFSGNSRTDTSFAPGCDVNNIVNHYAREQIPIGSPDDPNYSRIQHGYQGAASTLSYASAMRAKAEIDSAFALLPLSEREKYANSSSEWFEAISTPEPRTEAQEASQASPGETAPQDSNPGESDAESTITP